MDTFGTFLPKSTGIFDFIYALPRFAKERGIAFATPSEAAARIKPVGELSVPYPLSGTDEARDVSAGKATQYNAKPSISCIPSPNASTFVPTVV